MKLGPAETFPPSLHLPSLQMSNPITIIAKEISNEMDNLTLKLNQTFSNEEKMLTAIEIQIGKNTLPCKHCGKYEQPLTKFVVTFKKLFKDGKLTKIPKTCDKQRSINKNANPFNNPVTNTKGSIKYWEQKLLTATDDTEKTKINEELAKLRLKLADAEKSRDEWRTAQI